MTHARCAGAERTLKTRKTRMCHLLNNDAGSQMASRALWLDSHRRKIAMTIHRRSALKRLAATGVGILGAPAILRGEIEPRSASVF
jgi:hypothetical protein